MRSVWPDDPGSGSRCQGNALYSGGLTVWRGGRVGRRQPPAKRLQGQNLCPGFESRPLRQNAPLAQLDRASDYESEGQRFDSSRAYNPRPNRAAKYWRAFSPPCKEGKTPTI